MFSVIGIIIVYYVIYKMIKNRKEQMTQSGSTNGQFSQQGIPSGQANQRAPQQMQKTRQVVNYGQVPKSGQTQQNESETSSTMAYLEEKARQDAEEHAREKQEETQRLHKNFGGLRVAERLYEGNSVPNGKRCIVCGYCGAENLVPMMPREHYSCYFCREQIN